MPRAKRMRKIIKGNGLGRKEIKHSGKGTKGKVKLKKFKTKKGTVRFRVKK